MAGETSIHLRRAKEGDTASLQWLVDRLSPLLLAQARYRLSGPLRGACDPEDLVQEVWLVALSRLGDLQPRAGRETPVLLRFLATTLLHQASNLARRRIRRAAVEGEAEPDELPAPHPGVVTRLGRSETDRTLLAAIDALDAPLREILVLRGVEQHDVAEIATLLSLTSNAVSLRWNRALKQLRAKLPASVFHELA